MTAETFIHPAAVVEEGAKLGAGVRIGPFCHVSADSVLGDNVELVSHVSVMAGTTLGAGCKIYPNAVLGAPPQNMKHKGGRTTLIIGSNCIIREGVTMHTGSDSSRGTTTVGDDGFFMAYAHIAHDCEVGNKVTMANGATLGGHVELGHGVTIGGLTAIHQFVRIGDSAFIGGCSAVVGDVIPFAIAVGNRAGLRGLNVVGLRRSGLSRAELQELRRAYNMIFDRAQTVAENVERARNEFTGSPTAMKIIDFITSRGKRHYAVPPLKGSSGDDADDEV